VLAQFDVDQALGEAGAETGTFSSFSRKARADVVFVAVGQEDRFSLDGSRMT